jgi:predicted metal-dependent enzyme (double-stranded beta helix superfamily)
MTRREPALYERFLSEVLEEGEPLGGVETLGLAVDSIPLPPMLRARLESSLDRTHRFDDLEDVVAQLADLPLDQARTLLLRVDAPSTKWDVGPAPGIDLLHFDGGPRVQNAITGFVRHAPGTTFPEHDHVGDEQVLVLQGSFEDSDGVVYRSGEIAARGPCSSHSYRAVGPLPLVTMAVVQGGVIVDGVTIPPGDPRA